MLNERALGQSAMIVGNIGPILGDQPLDVIAPAPSARLHTISTVGSRCPLGQNPISLTGFEVKRSLLITSLDVAVVRKAGLRAAWERAFPAN
jgi:hypothetical protein